MKKLIVLSLVAATFCFVVFENRKSTGGEVAHWEQTRTSKHGAVRWIASIPRISMMGKVNSPTVAPNGSLSPSKQSRSLENLKKLLGSDNVGKAAYKVVLQRLILKSRKVPGGSECSTQANCPVSLLDLYSQIIEKVPTQGFEGVKTYIQNDIMASDLTQTQKAALFAQLMTSQDIQPNVNYSNGVGLTFNSDSVLFINAETNLCKTTPDLSAALASIIPILQATQDFTTRSVAMGPLLLNYPGQRDQIIASFTQAGLLHTK